MYAERGVIRYIDRARQINNFKNLLRPRNITPTDIDGLLDYGGKAFIYLEGKLIGKTTETGQRRALEAVVLSHWNANNPSMVLIFEHNTPLTDQVEVAFSFVRGVFCLKPIIGLTGRKSDYRNWWMPLVKEIPVLTAVELFEEQFKVFP